MTQYKLGSLFDGSGGFPLAGTLCGIEPVWAAEVEPYPIAVTRSRFPNMKHLGDISKINGAEIEPVDIITFGSPCQDLSVAGKRAGLKHEANGDEETTRSGLFMEAVRIIKEMRKATNGKHPRFALWENVPGAFSSNKGEDFRIVCEELVKIVEPTASMPPVPKGGWNYADSYRGDGWSLAYRVFDAQYWGVPQRRRRIHLVADFRGERAGEVLFEREGLRGYFAEGRTPWQATPADAEGSPGADDREGEGVFNESGRGYWMPGFGCLRAEGENRPSRPSMCIVQNADGVEGRGVDALTYAVDQGAGKSSASVHEEKSPTLACTHGGAPAVAYTLKIRSGCAVDANGKKATHNVGLNGEDKVCPTLIARMSSAVGTTQDALIVSDLTRYIVRRLTPTECARLQGFADRWGDIGQKDTFTEEEYRFWLDVRNTHAAIDGREVKEYTEKQMLTWYNKLHADAAEYKMWGNGIALPTALYCLQGARDALDAQEETPDWML